MRKLIWQLYADNMISLEVANLLLDKYYEWSSRLVYYIFMHYNRFSFCNVNGFYIMRNYKKELIQYLRYKKHYNYVEKRTVELRAKICKDATMHGTIGTVTRELYLKYNKYLIKLTNGRK